MEVEWDDRKARSNQEKQGIAFEEAATCLLDPNALVQEDGLSSRESRWILMGLSSRVRLLTVVYTLRGDRIRLISARKATRKEARQYA
ncbi:MAG: BrnT family toxin [Acidobacteria bacterium]|nr:BrnT family toxin [Acidobacteriota bacterium]